MELLGQGRRAVDVALDLGYADQPHLTRSLKAIMGKTPGEIAAAPRPLSGARRFVGFVQERAWAALLESGA